jgi:hypothetical protein
VCFSGDIAHSFGALGIPALDRAHRFALCHAYLGKARLAQSRAALRWPFSLPSLSLNWCAALPPWQRSRPWDLQALLARLRRKAGPRSAAHLHALCAHRRVLLQQRFAAGLTEPVNALRPLVRLAPGKALAAGLQDRSRVAILLHSPCSVLAQDLWTARPRVGSRAHHPYLPAGSCVALRSARSGDGFIARRHGLRFAPLRAPGFHRSGKGPCGARLFPLVEPGAVDLPLQRLAPSRPLHPLRTRLFERLLAQRLRALPAARPGRPLGLEPGQLVEAALLGAVRLNPFLRRQASLRAVRS